MKRLNKILIFFPLVLIAAISLCVSGLTCNSDDDSRTKNPTKQTYNKQNDDTTFKDIDTTVIENNNPEYVPPKDGSSNKYWNGNKHRKLLKDRECYFKNGLRKRKRDGSGNQDGKQLQKRDGQQRNRKGRK